MSTKSTPRPAASFDIETPGVGVTDLVVTDPSVVSLSRGAGPPAYAVLRLRKRGRQGAWGRFGSGRGVWQTIGVAQAGSPGRAVTTHEREEVGSAGPESSPRSGLQQGAPGLQLPEQWPI